MFLCYSKEIGVGVLFDRGVMLPAFQISLYMCSVFVFGFLEGFRFVLFLFLVIPTLGTRIGIRIVSLRISGGGAVAEITDFFLPAPPPRPPPQFRSGHAFDTCTQREFGALADELVCSRLGFRILLSVSALRAGTSTRSTPRLSVLLFLPPSPPPFDAVPRSRERGEGPRVCYLHLSDEKLGRL